ncbi:hypothetical protein PVL29_019489 [Vitis rotundifolia]|uniref:glutathione transferase n=1 Tax=Vitis rotundifolia TaxID=103349 RepID=A0AA39DDM6_VITRO|nr:hypothetical protein PVL29_019489 [Vitis rotundifolia]
MVEEVKLFKTFSSPFALRIYKTIFEDPSNKSRSLLHYNPVKKQIRVLVHNGKPIAESLVILEYIDETWKQAPLLPEDPYENAMAWKEQEEAIVPAIETLKFLEEELMGKKFFGGETIRFADLALGRLANLISILEEIVGLKVVDGEKFPLLSSWMQDFADAPIIKDNWPPRDRMIVKFQALRDAIIAAAAAASK